MPIGTPLCKLETFPTFLGGGHTITVSVLNYLKQGLTNFCGRDTLAKICDWFGGRDLSSPFKALPHAGVGGALEGAFRRRWSAVRGEGKGIASGCTNPPPQRATALMQTSSVAIYQPHMVNSFGRRLPTLANDKERSKWSRQMGKRRC